jgi:hypothetical protein
MCYESLQNTKRKKTNVLICKKKQTRAQPHMTTELHKGNHCCGVRFFFVHRTNLNSTKFNIVTETKLSSVA